VPDLRSTGFVSQKERCLSGVWRFLGPPVDMPDRRRRTAVGGLAVIVIKEESDVFVTHI